ncbi:hypothetical protein KAFR_0F04000 [Kazachstania africana CBS 2517]|uniref:UDENN FLCN/SMCR8-type domain-containing protein n=1 Tax=Kazachstania africana (strain ATCC 22294 / BCRC 22015 / CBS 2517 / CECT 1963 / NBRC 1671 / NRRL Y-8276) TaxID=1071382 RepID=H2AX95_KAZAF|nr:hypothetical protein KAFR_0F04000 [Kazachstania africana CBS 2517]CCF58995.1 hypothetical protein KAFR_0F04000 [Kazachstania africana CBS 2517]
MIPITISLAHFCDKHGPISILVTQSNEDKDENSKGDTLLAPNYPTDSFCASCLLEFPNDGVNDVRSMRSIINNRAYVTTQYSTVRYQLLNSIIKKCFSEETMVYDTSSFVFFDSMRGLNLVMGFKLYDENARGNERRYCFILSIDSSDNEKAMSILSKHWDFIISGFHKMIDFIKQSHDKTISSNHKDDTNSSSFTPIVGNYLRSNKSKFGRSLADLTNDKSLFIRMHKWNSYLLSSLTSRRD